MTYNNPAAYVNVHNKFVLFVLHTSIPSLRIINVLFQVGSVTDINYLYRRTTINDVAVQRGM